MYDKETERYAINQAYSNPLSVYVYGPYKRISDHCLVLEGFLAVTIDNEKPWGLVSVMVDLDEFSRGFAFQYLDLPMIDEQGYRYHLYKKNDNGEIISIVASNLEAEKMQTNCQATIDLNGTQMTLAISKQGGWIEKVYILQIVGLGIVIWLLTMFAISRGLDARIARKEAEGREEIGRAHV